ncbi:MAG: hemolysin III family protein [Candidatus Didemnitutus sp.]|nr:hemolysin III family protein [Candidatus Didemnitutus sp.]
MSVDFPTNSHLPAASLAPNAYPPHEELANRLTHGIGALLSVTGLVLMVAYSAMFGDAWIITSTAIYGATLVLLYASSTLYHSVTSPRWRRICQRIDHAAIYLLIAGTYTPFVLGPLRGAWGWSLFGVVWGLAIVGVVLKFFFAGRFNVISTLAYLAMGWLVVIAAKPLMAAVPSGALWLLVAGGLSYSLGTIFYLWERLPYNHAVWHVWVMAGSVCHWVAVFGYLVPSGAA